MFNNYFHGEEADQFAFFRIPKVLMKAPRYEGLRLEAKVLYGLMLDRMALSRKNGWLDEEGRVFIIYTNDSVSEDLSCSRQNTVLFLKQLEDAGLIRRVRRGQGLPSLIYVLKFASEDDNTDHPDGGSENGSERTEKFQTKNDTLTSKTGSESDFEHFEKPETKRDKLTSTKCEVVKNSNNPSKTKKFRGWISRSSKSELQEVRDWNSNNTDINNTDSESIYLSSTDFNDRQIERNKPVKKEPVTEVIVTQLESSISSDSIKEQIDYNSLKANLPDDDRLGDIVYIIQDVMNSKNITYKIHGNIMPSEKVKSSFSKLTSRHIRYVLDSLNSITYSIRNMRAYMISALYTATQTINLFDANKGNIGNESPYKGNVGTVRVNKFNNFPQREIDFDAMEQLVFGY